MIQINNKMLREMRNLYLEGYGTKKIAKKLKLHITTIRDYLWRHSKDIIVEVEN